MITRRIGKLLRGNATPAQIFLACLIGGMLGFMPTFGTAAGLIVLLTLGLIVLNANLVLAAFVGLAAKAISIPLLPVSFAAGRVLLDGPTQPLFKAAVNAPVLALFGFEYYATTGGLLLGAVFGLVCGFAAVALLRRFRTAMAALEAGNERYKQWAGKGWVKALTWVFFGGGPKGGYAEAMGRKGGMIRPIGVVVAVLFVGLLVIVQMFFAGPIVTAVAQRSLERANGATVDLESAEVDLPGGKMVVTGLAMADPNALGTDLLRAERVEIDISAADLLRKRAPAGPRRADRCAERREAHGAGPPRRPAPAPGSSCPAAGNGGGGEDDRGLHR